MKHFRNGQRVRITGDSPFYSRFGIIVKPCFFGGYLVKVACKRDRERSLLFGFASPEGTRPVLIDDCHLQPID